jgi:cytochrome P450
MTTTQGIGSQAGHDVDAWVLRLFGGDPETIAHPYPAYRAVRGAGPVFSAALPDGSPCWHVTGNREVKAALRDTRLSSRYLLGRGEADAMLRLMLVRMDPPDHTRVRRIMHRAFTPRVVARLRTRVGDLVDGLLDTAERSGRFDVVADLADALPTQVIASLLGVPANDWPRFKAWSRGVMTLGPPPDDAFERGRQMALYLWSMINDRRGEPRDDLISGLVAARDREELSDFELVAQCVMLLVGGHETTTYAIGSSTVALLRRPATWAAFGRIPPGSDAMTAAVEELLRFEPPFHFVARGASTDVEIAGHTIPAGARVWLWVGAANRDPAAFAAPDVLDLRRRDNPHVTFGHGIHACLGAMLAKLNLEVALTRLHDRYPALALIPEELRWREDLGIRGPEVLPVRTA